MGYNNFMLRMRNSSIQKDRIFDSRLFLEQTFSDDPSFRKNIEVVNRGFVNPRMFGYKKQGNLAPKMDIQTTISEQFYMGDIFVVDGEYWLCIESNDFHEIYRAGKIKQCNHCLVWQDTIMKEIKNCWCVLERPYSADLNTGEIITTSQKQYKVQMPFNIDSQKLYMDKRFIIETAYSKSGKELPLVYKLTSFDSVAQTTNGVGFLVLTFTQDLYNEETDNAELMIADWVHPNKGDVNTSPFPPSVNCNIQFKGLPQIIIGGNEKLFKAVSTNNHALENPTWKLTIPTEYEKFFIQKQTSNSILVRALNKPILEGQTLLLELTDESSTCYSSIEIKVVSSI